MTRFNNPLDNLKVASPCNADWDEMIGNNRARFCGQCNLNVYNLSSMTRAEAELLIGRTEDRLCVRYFRRADGSVLTQDCPVGLQAVRRRMSYVFRALNSAVLVFFAAVGLHKLGSVRWAQPTTVTGVMAVEEPTIVPETQGALVMPPTLPVLGRAVSIPPKKAKVRKRAVSK